MKSIIDLINYLHSCNKLKISKSKNKIVDDSINDKNYEEYIDLKNINDPCMPKTKNSSYDSLYNLEKSSHSDQLLNSNQIKLYSIINNIVNFRKLNNYEKNELFNLNKEDLIQIIVSYDKCYETLINVYT
jgi:hypothetical protein